MTGNTSPPEEPRVTLFSDSAVVGALVKEKERSEERQERLDRAIGALIAAEGAMRSWSTKSPGDWWHIANSVHHAIHAARGECCHGLPEADCDACAMTPNPTNVLDADIGCGTGNHEYDDMGQCAACGYDGTLALMADIARRLPDAAQVERGRELLCQRCDQDYPVWHAPNDLWNATIRGGSMGGREAPNENFLCPSCFAALAEERGAVGPHTRWRFEVAE